ncbi:cytochrome c [Neolewinella lacunae]|uniref:Cytochrome c n=1 Tax=Neolewinella lacunae TaxID=1517758 RepID=A0A923PMH3_9BACT|nr:cytochrome c [Neolewinella lacunae]MBC6996782.1 cytochrome c [Neolewinella lacunae]MDN3637010.1 cytochrome c [Neolewinella lacunae]
MRYVLYFLPLIVLLLVFGCGKTDNVQGHNLYDQHCANCHGEYGEGLRRLIPPLAGADYLRDNPREVVRGIRYGMQGPLVANGITYDEPMPGNEDLTEFQIVNIVNYLHQAWGNDYGGITVEQARAWLKE